MIKRQFLTIADVRRMLDGYRLLFDAEPEVRVTAVALESPTRDILFDRMGGGFAVSHIGNKFITVAYAEEGGPTQYLKFDPQAQPDTMYLIFE